MKLYPAAVRLYIAESGRVRTPTSEKTITKVLRSLQSEFPTNHLEDFTEQELTWFCLNRHDGKEGNPAPKTIAQRKAYICTTFEWFTFRKLIKHNPALTLKFTVKPGKGSVRHGQWLTEQDVQTIYRSFDASDEIERRNRLIFLFGVSTGLRLFEIAQLTWQHFTPDLKSIMFVGKGDKPAEVHLPSQVREELLAWKREAWQGATAVFPSVKEKYNFRKGKRERVLNWDLPLGTDGMRYVIRKAGDQIGLRLNPHDLRRSYAGILEERGVSLKNIQGALRHEHLATTDKYLQSSPSRARVVAESLEFEL